MKHRSFLQHAASGNNCEMLQDIQEDLCCYSISDFSPVLHRIRFTAALNFTAEIILIHDNESQKKLFSHESYGVSGGLCPRLQYCLRW